MSANALPASSTSLTPALRLGREGGPDGCGERPVQWQMQRNCSLAPRQMVAAYLLVCGLSSAIAAFFWMRGATFVLPFTAIELVALGAALLVYARHARDRESIRLQDGRLIVEHSCGARTLRVDFQPAWVRVEPELGDRSLVELSGQGRRVAVGRYLRPELRRQLANEIRWALRRRPAFAGAGAA
jgi:uncharacterized membrane protein